MRVAAIAENISFVDVVQTNFPRNFARTMQSFRRSARLILQFEIGMKRGEVQWNIRAEILQNPFGEFARFVFVVVQRGNHQIGDFEPHVRFVFQALESFENGREMRERNFSVEILCERFQIDIRGVNVIVDFVTSLVGNVAVRDHHGVEAAGVGGFGDVDDVFGPNGGLVVSKCDGRAAVIDGEVDDLLGLRVRGMDLIAARFGNVPILAEKTAHVAAGGAHGENFRSRKKMIQRLFLDGIDLNSSGRGVAEAIKFAAAIDANEAEAGLAFADVAVAGAKVTMNFAGGVGFPPTGFVKRLRFLFL